jgi:hypothetical protein
MKLENWPAAKVDLVILSQMKPAADNDFDAGDSVARAPLGKDRGGEGFDAVLSDWGSEATASP